MVKIFLKLNQINQQNKEQKQAIEGIRCFYKENSLKSILGAPKGIL